MEWVYLYDLRLKVGVDGRGKIRNRGRARARNFRRVREVDFESGLIFFIFRNEVIVV